MILSVSCEEINLVIQILTQLEEKLTKCEAYVCKMD